MASIFTYQEEPPRVHSPWSTPGTATPQRSGHLSQTQHILNGGQVSSITKLEPERPDGPTEYKLHLLLRSRRYQSAVSASQSSLHVAQDTDVLSQASAESANARPPYQHVPNSRQARLQQLTTQLLWRLQQSSPFHSSSNADLVLPVLPEATPRLVPSERPTKALPGLEESQGALYEIGVADDGTLVGLVEEELDESLNNLRAMAASLGCVVDILRRVLIGQHEQRGGQYDGSDRDPTRMWVAEVLVRPDTKSPRVQFMEQVDVKKTFSNTQSNGHGVKEVSKTDTEQLRIAITGATSAGKSSLVGTLTTSKLDNGRGKSRLSLLKHRHEIASGITSSVAQELLGYREDVLTSQTVVNYATGDVSSWPDIHNLASRTVFLSDSPGLPRYAKSIFRSLISWEPSWTLLCVAADEDDNTFTATAVPGTANPLDTSSRLGPVDPTDLSLAHLDMCLKLDLPLVVVVTKMDIATKSGLRSVLSKLLSALKSAGRVPALLASPSKTISNQDENVDIASELASVTGKEHSEMSTLLDRVRRDVSNSVVPIVLTSAVTGAGMGKLHALLKDLPPKLIARQQSDTVEHSKSDSVFHVDEIFAIPPSKVYSENQGDHSADHGIVLCGRIAAGKLAVGDQLRLGPFTIDSDLTGEDGLHTPRSSSYCNDSARRPLPRALSGLLSKSLQPEQQKSSSTPTDTVSVFLDVYVVSLRSLRLPVRSMESGETGTVGVQPITQPSMVALSRARKGMILTSVLSDNLCGYRSFSATFPASDFVNSGSPTLILGGHAIVYVNSVRAAVKVTALSFDDSTTRTEPSSPTEVFDFDGDEHDMDTNGYNSHNRIAKIVFRFISTIEWMEVGNRLLVIPSVTAAGPIAGPPVVFSGLSGFVGTVHDVFT